MHISKLLKGIGTNNIQNSLISTDTLEIEFALTIDPVALLNPLNLLEMIQLPSHCAPLASAYLVHARLRTRPYVQEQEVPV